MSGRGRRISEETFSLFPFLAVLLCAMGTLTMIFVAIARDPAPVEESAATEPEFDPEAGLGELGNYGKIADASTLARELGRNRLGADEDAERDDAYERALLQTNAATLDELVAEKESVEWLLEELRSTRARVGDSLEEERARLARAEEALARERERRDVDLRRVEALTSEEEAKESEEALRARLAALDVELEELRLETEKLRERNKDAKRSYAIIPYQGKKGTFRRPIYVECDAEGVFLQPEGLRFDDADFLLARYPGNPFDSALRAAARHYVETSGQRTASGDVLEPYPLLIVRPGGARYFYAALAALASWGDLYGYEFVAEDQRIEYPESDPTLLRLASDRVSEARARLAAQLNEALSIQRAIERGAGDPRFGGNANESAGSELQSQLGSNFRLGAARPGAVSGRGEARESGGRVADGWNPGYNGAFGRYVIDRAAARGTGRLGGASAAPGGSGEGSGGAGEIEGESVGSGGGDGTAGESQTQYVANAGATEERGDAPGYMKAFIAEEESKPESAPGTAGVEARQTLGNTTYAKGATGTASAGTLAKRGSEEKETEKESLPREAFRLSQDRRENSAVERPVLVRCEESRIVFPRQAGVRAETRIERSKGSSGADLDRELMEAFAFCAKSWGAAGRDAYWAPFIKADVLEGGEERFRELSEFCERQGLAIVRVETSGTGK
ncbi:MAG: hypothetical protein IJM30_02470 [Thermoguttaceae bacterium]|nr:hypothetical protein [Thermoguttaceae bacterium]